MPQIAGPGKARDFPGRLLLQRFLRTSRMRPQNVADQPTKFMPAQRSGRNRIIDRG
jgi:hypothetical protein